MMETLTYPFEKSCFKCQRTLPIANFYKHPKMGDGHLGKCKECTKKDVRVRYAATRPQRAAYERERNQRRERRAKRREYSNRQDPVKRAAWTAVSNAVRDGKLTPQPCEVCGEEAQAHHEDYAKPLDVRWLCFVHHREHHGQVVTATWITRQPF
jgi:hypothetical protein